MLKGGQAAPQPPVASGEATPGSEAAVAPAPVAPTQEATVAIGGASGSGASKALNPESASLAISSLLAGTIQSERTGCYAGSLERVS